MHDETFSYFTKPDFILYIACNQPAKKQEQAGVGVTAVCIFAPSFCNSQGGSTLIQVGAQGAFAKFSRDDEAQADEVGVQFTTRANIDPRGIPSMFKILLDERKTDPGGVEVFFASHPLEESRIADTNAEIAKINPVILQGTTVDSPAFQAFKRRLASLPRPKVVAK